MTVETPRIRSLLRQADSVAAAGKRAAAEQLYLQIIDEAPDTFQAWRGLAQVARKADDREEAMKRALELNPDFRPGGKETDEPTVQPETEVSETTFSGDGQISERQTAQSVVKSEAEGSVQEASHAHTHEPLELEADQAVEKTEKLFCANHPGRQTHLRCNRCGKPICSSCANPTPVGYRCPECIREQEDVYFTATPFDYVITVLVALPVSLVIGWLATLIMASSLGFFLIFLGAFAGSLVGRVAFRAARRRRGRWLPHLVVACVVIGAILPALPFILAALSGHFSLRLIFWGIYLFTAAGATYYQMR